MPITAFPVSSRYGASHSSLIRALYAGELARHLQADDPNLRHLRPLFCRTDSWGPRLPERLRKQVKHLSPVMAVLLEETARLFSPLDPSGSTVECGVQVPRLDIDLRELPPLEWESVAWQAGRLAVDLHRFNLLGREIEPCNDFVHTKTVYVLTALQAFVVVSVHMYVNQVLRGLFSFPVTDGVTYKVPGLCFHRLKASKKSMTQKYVCLFTYLVERCAVCVNLLHEWQQPGFDSSRSSSWCELNRGIIIMRRELTTNPEKDAFSRGVELTPVTFSEQKIEDRSGALHADFACPWLGGAVLGFGCVQEEILFVTNPELLVTMAIEPVLQPREAVVVVGTRQLVHYSGYRNGFTCQGIHKHSALAATSKPLRCVSLLAGDPLMVFPMLSSVVVAIDALKFSGRRLPPEQYSSTCVYRELSKCLAGIGGSVGLPENGFLLDKLQPSHKVPFATGNWGCGAYKGDPCFKLLIQWVACSLAEREMVFSHFEERSILENIRNIQQLKSHSVSSLLSSLTQVGDADSFQHLLSEDAL